MSTPKANKTYRQAQSVWNFDYRVPDNLKEKVPLSLCRIEGGKIPRAAQPQIGAILTDEFGYRWQVKGVELHLKKIESRKRGKIPLAILELIEPLPTSQPH